MNPTIKWLDEKLHRSQSVPRIMGALGLLLAMVVAYEARLPLLKSTVTIIDKHVKVNRVYRDSEVKHFFVSSADRTYRVQEWAYRRIPIGRPFYWERGLITGRIFYLKTDVHEKGNDQLHFAFPYFTFFISICTVHAFVGGKHKSRQNGGIMAFILGGGTMLFTFLL